MNPRFSLWFENATGMLLRSHEQKRLTGATYLMIASFLTILLYDRWIAFSALLFVVISDALGGLVGKRWGRHRIREDRSVEGSMVFLFSALIIVLANPHVSFLVGLAGAVTALLVEIFFRYIDDNLTIPLCSGFTMQCLTWVLS